MLEWDGHVNIAGDVRWVSQGVHRIDVGELKADNSTLTWGNMTFAKGKFYLRDCKVSGQVTVDKQASLSTRNSKFDPEVQVKGRVVSKCDVKTQEEIGCAKATACNDQQSLLECWCPHGEKGEYRGQSCETQNVTCRPGWQPGNAGKTDAEPCVPCDGLQDRYSLSNQCRVCPEGFECKEGYFRVRPKENGFWMGHPYYMSCVSNATLQALSARGVNISTYIARAEGDRTQQEYMGVPHAVLEKWKCGGNSTMISSSAQSRSDGAARVYPCPNPDACIVQDDGTADCAAGYRGPLCGLCQEGHVWSEGHVCKPCTGDTLAWRVGMTVGACVVALIAYGIFLASPYFEDRHGVGPAKRVLAWASQRWSCCRRAAAPPQHRAPPSGPSQAPTCEPSAYSLERLVEPIEEPVETAQETFETLGDYLERLGENLEFTEEKEGAQAQSLIGYLQVALRVHTACRVCTYRRAQPPKP
jgi:hypothetical protein